MKILSCEADANTVADVVDILEVVPDAVSHHQGKSLQWLETTDRRDGLVFKTKKAEVKFELSPPAFYC